MAKKEFKILHYEIVNWDKYQSDNTKVWIKLDNDHLLDPKIQTLTATQYRIWLGLLCTSGRQVNAGKGSILYSTLHSLCKNRGSNLQVSIDKLLELNMIILQIDRKIDTKSDTFKKVSKKGSEKKVFLTDQKLDELYASYPKKMGKSKGYEKLKKIVTNEKELLNFEAAIKNYKKEISANETEPKYQKHYSTFVNCYEDYVSGALTGGRVQSDRPEESAALKRLRESGINDDFLD